jgi:hypothetical protein
MYRLVSLRKDNGDGTVTVMWSQWIRSELAVVGNVIDKLKDVDSGVIRSGFTVVDASDEQRAESQLISKLHKYEDLSKKCDL